MIYSITTSEAQEYCRIRRRPQEDRTSVYEYNNNSTDDDDDANDNYTSSLRFRKNQKQQPHFIKSSFFLCATISPQVIEMCDRLSSIIAHVENNNSHMTNRTKNRQRTSLSGIIIPVLLSTLVLQINAYSPSWKRCSHIHCQYIYNRNGIDRSTTLHGRRLSRTIRQQQQQQHRRTFQVYVVGGVESNMGYGMITTTASNSQPNMISEATSNSTTISQDITYTTYDTIHQRHHTPIQSVQSSISLSSSSTTTTKTSSSSTTMSSSYSSTEGLSKFHRSLLRHSGSNRQRFVTGRYPVILTFRKNPTRKWLNLGLLQQQRRTRSTSSSIPNTIWQSSEQQQQQHIMAEIEVYVNGTIASQSLASLDRFYWYENSERKIQQEQYGLLSMELLAEIYIDRPAYVNIMSSTYAGRRASMSYKMMQQSVKNKNKRWTLQAMNLLKLYNEGQSQHHTHSSRENHYGYNKNKYQELYQLVEGFSSSNALDGDRLWVSSFAVTGKGQQVWSIDCDQCCIQSLNGRSKSKLLWPNEVQSIPSSILQSSSLTSTQRLNTNDKFQPYQDAILVCDGFLVPTKDSGGLYVVKNPGHHETEWTVALTQSNNRWFYHRAIWIDLTGDGRLSILSARCQVSTGGGRNSGDVDGVDGTMIVTSGIIKRGQLVWLECPKPAMIDPQTGTPLDSDGTIFDPFHTRYLPWKERVLATGPDVMFSVADLDPTDDTIEVMASEFFNKQVSLISIQRGMKPKVVMKRKIDDQSGQAFGSILANIEISKNETDTSCRVIDAGSTVNCLSAGDTFSHLFVTSHECNFITNDESLQQSSSGDNPPSAQTQSPEGGSLYAYRVPAGKDAWKTEPWHRTIIASGFRVQGKLSNLINPGAPGFVYTFYANIRDAQARSKRPLIAVAGDCAESAYIFRPDNENIDNNVNGNDSCTNYKLMAEIQCESTVGSIGIGYNDFSTVEQEKGYAKLYIPCFEKDKILVFGLGSGEDDGTNDNW